MIIEVQQGKGAIKKINLRDKFRNCNIEDIEVFYSGCVAQSIIPKDNFILIWVFKRLEHCAIEMGLKSPLNLEVLTQYLLRTKEIIEKNNSKRVHLSYFRKFIKAICPEHENMVVRKPRSANKNRGLSGNFPIKKRNMRALRGIVNLDKLHSERNNLAKTAKILSKPKHSRKSVSPTSDELKVQPESNVTPMTPHIIKYFNSNNIEVEMDLKEELNLSNYSDDVLERVIKLLTQSGWSGATIGSNVNQLRQVFQYNDRADMSSSPLDTKVMRNYILDLRDKVQRGLVKNSNATISQKQRNCNAILKALGCPQIPKFQKLKVKAGGNELATDAYDTREWMAIIRSLHFKRKEMAEIIYTSNSVPSYYFNDYMINSCLMMAIYTSATQTELFTATYPDQKVSYIKTGTGTYVTKGIKNRATRVTNFELNLKHNGMKFLSEFIPISRKLNAMFNKTEYSLFLLTDGKLTRELNSSDLNSYARRLINADSTLRAIKENDSKFSINTQRIRSSIVSKVQNERGEANSVIVGRHSLSVNRSHNYSKANRRENQRELGEATNVLEEYARHSGDLELAIESAGVKLNIEIKNKKEYDELKSKSKDYNDLPNGGTCKNLDTKEKKQFKKSLEGNKTLSENDKNAMGCGYLVKCFGCDNFGVVDDVNDIWRLLSFEKKLNESIEFHVSLEHFLKNYAELKLNLQDLKSRLTPKKLAAANKRLLKQIHPFWDDVFSIEDVLRPVHDIK